MPRQREIPKINSVTVIYNGDGKTFDTFMESMINDYLNSDSMSKCSDSDFIEKVELVKKGVEGSTHAKLYYVRNKSKREIDRIYSRVTKKTAPVKPAKATKAK